MGTSQSHNLKSSPNWSAAKRAMTSLANGTDNKPASNAKFFGNLGIALGNGLYRVAELEGMEVREAEFVWTCWWTCSQRVGYCFKQY